VNERQVRFIFYLFWGGCGRKLLPSAGKRTRKKLEEFAFSREVLICAEVGGRTVYAIWFVTLST
jgi:hypothetical protein